MPSWGHGRGKGGHPLCPEYPAGVEALCPERGTQMLPGQGAVGQSPNNWFRGGHPQENKAGVQDPKVPAGAGQPEVFGCGQRWSMGSLVPRVSPAAHPWLPLGMPCIPAAPGMFPSLPRL